MLTFVKPMHPENAQSPIDVTLSGMLILVKPMQPENAHSPIDVTSSGITTSVIFLLSTPTTTLFLIIKPFILFSIFKTPFFKKDMYMAMEYISYHIHNYII